MMQTCDEKRGIPEIVCDQKSVLSHPLSREISVSHWYEAKELFGDMQNGGWIFRGQADSEWSLKTSLERVDNGKKDYRDIEKKVYENFVNGAHEYLNSEKSPVGYYEWLSLIQHHSGYTRLIDWTKSPYIASYFAVREFLSGNNIKKDFSVWAIKRDTLNVIDSEFFSDKNNDKDDPKCKCMLINEAKINNCNNELGDHCKCALILKPKYSNKRMQQQQAVMLMPNDVSTTFEENLYSSLDKLDHSNKNTSIKVIKFIFKWKNNKELLESLINDLEYMNINEVTLFPNLDGLARQINRDAARKKSIEDIPIGGSLNRYFIGKKLITIDIKVENKSGTLLEVLKVFKEETLNIEASFWTPRDTDKFDYWLFTLSHKGGDDINSTSYKVELENKIKKLSDIGKEKFDATVFF